MRRRSFNWTILLYCLLFSITAQSQLRKIYLNPKAPGREKQSKFIDSLRFIPLELKEGIQLSPDYNIQVTEKYLLLNDYINKRLLVYSKDGHFKKDLNYDKLGGNFYPSYQERTNQITFFGPNKNYTLTTKDQIQIKLDWDNPRNKKYFKKYTVDLNDPLLTVKKDVPSQKDISQVYHYYNDYFIQGQIGVSPLYKDSLDYEFKLYKNNQLVKSFFPYNRVNEPKFMYGGESVSFNNSDTPYINILTRPYCDTIYKMIKDSLFPYYQLVLPLENSLPKSFFTQAFKNRTDRDNFNRNNAMVFHQIYSFYETPRFIYFMVRYLYNSEFYVYEKQTTLTWKTKNIKGDSSQYNLQLLVDYGTQRKGDRFYKPQRASELIAFFDKNKNVPIPKELQGFLKSKPSDNAPVIVEFKFKN